MNLVLTYLALAALPLFALGMTAFNLVAWPRGRPDSPGSMDGSVSVLIPARDEAETIEACVRAAFGGQRPPDEVIVYDDGSTDMTPEILARLRREFDRLRVIAGRPLPPGWVGKPHACHRLAEAARGDYLIFVDADVTLTKTGLNRLLSLFDTHRADLVTAVPRQETDSFVERLILPLLHVTYTSWFPLPLTWRSSDPRFLAANGQLLAIRRAAYESTGGFEAVRGAVVDDMAICRLAKTRGYRVVFADGARMARCRMYGSASEVWEGFSKNLYEGIGARSAALVGVVGLYLGTFVAPYLGLGVALWAYPGWLGAAAVGVGANIALRGLLIWRHAHPIEGILLHPIGVIGLVAIAVNSFVWHRRGAIRWSGRTYAASSEREDP